MGADSRVYLLRNRRIRLILIGAISLLLIALWYSTIRQSGRPVILEMSAAGEITSIEFSPDGQTLAGGIEDGSISLWRIGKGRTNIEHTLKVHKGRVGAIACTPDGKTLASVGPDGIVKLWDVGSQNSRQVVKLKGKEDYSLQTSAAFLPDGRTLAVNFAGILNLLDTQTGSLKPLAKTLKTDTKKHRYVLSTNGKVAVLNNLENIELRSTPTGKLLCKIEWFDGGPAGFSRNGKYIALGADFSVVTVYETTTGRKFNSFVAHKGRVGAVAYSPDGKLLASGGAMSSLFTGGSVKLWNAGTGSLERSLADDQPLDESESDASVTDILFSPDGATLAVSTREGKIKLWSVR